MHTPNSLDIDLGVEIEGSFDDNQDYSSLEELEYWNKMNDPFRNFKKGEFWLASKIFCSCCGKDTFPFILDKTLIDENH